MINLEEIKKEMCQPSPPSRRPTPTPYFHPLFKFFPCFALFAKINTCVRYFLLIFYFFTKRWPFQNYEKYFLFHLKSSFRSWDIPIFQLFPFFYLLSRLKKTNGIWIYYVMNWLAWICRYNFCNNSKTTLYYAIKLGQIVYN